MRRVWTWVSETLFRLLGLLSRGSLALRRIRLVVPLSWIAVGAGWLESSYG